MEDTADLNQGAQRVVRRDYVARRAETEDAFALLPSDSQAGLRQYSLERMVGYGLDYSDAVEMRASVMDGVDWKTAATNIAARCLSRAERAPPVAGAQTQILYLRRASALLRMSQAMMLTDTDERREIFARAAGLCRQAAALAGDRAPVLIRSNAGQLAGWLHDGGASAVASVLVIGGVEGWAMDFSGLGDALAARGVHALLLDGPGQGETRFTHHHYLTADWREAYGCAINYLEQKWPQLPIGFVGNSMGGSFAMAVANDDRRISACCNNGGPIAPWMAPQEGTFFAKMMALANATDKQQAVEVWSTVRPAAGGANSEYRLLLIQGAEDPLVSNELADMLFKSAPTPDKLMVVFSDGDHCIYRHKDDRDVLISDWMRARLTGRSWSDEPVAEERKS